MGPDQSQPNIGTQSFGSAGASHNNNNVAGNFHSNESSFQNHNVSSLNLNWIRTGFAGSWSIYFPQKHPKNRYGHCFIIDKETNSIVIAFGTDNQGSSFSDAWVFNMQTMKWNLLADNIGHSRVYSTATQIGREMIIFGGVNPTSFYQNNNQDESYTYYGDFLSINLDTGSVTSLPSGPIPRCNGILFTNNESIFLWSGFNGQVLSDFNEFSIDIGEWISHPEIHLPGRGAAVYTSQLISKTTFIFGSTRTHPVIRFDFGSTIGSKISPEMLRCSGDIPPPELEHSMICIGDEFLFVIGGESENPFTHLYTLDIRKKLWFFFHLLPDNKTTTFANGSINNNGTFLVPRQHSGTLGYCEKSRSLICLLGFPLLSTPLINTIYIGEALAILHLRNDMIEVLGKDIM